MDYLDGVKYANLVTLDFVKKILLNAPNSIIVILSDHGSRVLKNVTPAIKEEESYSNFCAIYYPDGDYSGVYDSISPINVMRLVLNKTLTTNFEKLPKK